MTTKYSNNQMNDTSCVRCHCCQRFLQQLYADNNEIHTARTRKQSKSQRVKHITLALAITLIVSNISHSNLIVQASSNNNLNTPSANPTDLQDLRSQLSLSDAINSQGENFPGVSKDVAPFCSARPSLQIDMASMIVHVKRNASFNYKLYLFSEDYVFQTGQIVPRDDFRIHAFPVKAKRLRDFWPSDVSTFEEGLNSLKPIGSELFQYRKFFASVPTNPATNPPTTAKNSPSPNNNNDNLQDSEVASVDPISTSSSQGEPVDLSGMRRRSTRSNPVVDVASPTNNRPQNLNENIEFDRDDQVSLVAANPPLQIVNNNNKKLQEPVVVVPNASIMAAALRLRNQDADAAATAAATGQVDDTSSSAANGKSAASAPSASSTLSEPYRDTQTIIPVGAFSSFHVNISYFVRKDFRQTKPELIKVGINANSFKVSYVTLIRDLARGPNNEHSSDDYQFLNHKLLSDPNTRITAISQIYHDWITRNFYTVVYIQRLHQVAHFEPGDLSSEETTNESSSSAHQQSQQVATISNDRLIFRGSSANLLGAVQLDYGVRASAFITDKNGLHYFLDFLSSSNKFYIAAVDWTEKPFKFIDSQRFPIKVTRTLLDNEELLLCPPAFCHSVSPVDELVAYGRLSLNDETQLATGILSGNVTSSALPSTQLDMENVIRSVQQAALSDLKVKLHLRDWIWQLESPSSASSSSQQSLQRNLRRRNSGPFIGNGSTSTPTGDHSYTKANFTSSISSSPFLTFDLPVESGAAASATVSPSDKNNVFPSRRPQPQHRPFSWRYKWAQRNDIKARNDIYGYPLTGNNIDAAFRVYNKLHLVSANFLITINYARENETQITKKLIGEEFQQLSSTIIDPISAVFYDRYANQVFFFKGDRYIGYDYATRKPIEDFLLNDNTKDGAPMALSSLPVVGILGRQHSVDGIYHDLATDLVHIFEGMKFYSYDASEFKSGSFRSETNKKLPPMRCINTHFLTGCHFDKAFPNPCRDSSSASSQPEPRDSSSPRNGKSLEPDQRATQQQQQPQQQQQQKNHWPFVPSDQSNQFIGKQQQKVRELAKSKLVDILGKENAFNSAASQDISGYVGLPSEPSPIGGIPFGAARLSPSALAEQQLDSSSSRRHEKALIYMLASLVLLTILATIAIVAMSIYSASGNSSGNSATAIRHLSSHTGKSSPTSTVQTQLPAPYDSLAQLQASAIQAAYEQQQQHQLNKHAQLAGDYATGALTRYMAIEPYGACMVDSAPIGLPLGPPSPSNSSYIRTGLDSMSPYGTAGDHSASSTPPNGSTLRRHAHNQGQYNKAFNIAQNSNTLVVKGRRYDTQKREDYIDNSVL